MVDTRTVKKTTISDNHCAGLGIDINSRRQFIDRLLIAHSVRQNEMTARNDQCPAVCFVNVSNWSQYINRQRTSRIKGDILVLM